MTAKTDPLQLIEGHPFDDLVDADERRRIDARVATLLEADAAIKEVRLACGVAQTAVAEFMGVTKSSVAQLEGRDIESIQIGTLNRYFGALGFKVRVELDRIDA